MALIDILESKSANAHDSASFRQVVEDHLTFLTDHPDNRIYPVNDNDAYRFQGDFYGLLQAIGVNESLNYITLRINGLRSSMDFGGNINSVRVITDTVFHRLYQTYKTQQKKNVK